MLRSELSRTLGTWIRQERTRKGWTQDDLASRSQLSRPAVSDIERGASFPEDLTLGALIEALGVAPPHFTIEGDDSAHEVGARALHAVNGFCSLLKASGLCHGITPKDESRRVLDSLEDSDSPEDDCRKEAS